MSALKHLHHLPVVFTAATLWCASPFAGQVESYYPLATEPGWTETSVSKSFFDGSTIRAESRNLLGLDPEDRIIMPIINGFRGTVPIETISHSDGGEFNDPFSTIGRSDQSVDETGNRLWNTTAASLNGGSGQGAASITLDSTTTYTGLGLGDAPTDGVRLIRRIATIGEVTLVRYHQLMESTSSSPDFDLRTVSNDIVDRRSVYAGTDTINNLYGGSDPLIVTESYEALVRVSETNISGSTETFMINGRSETSLGVTDNFGPSITTIEWTVKGVGLVKLLIVFIEWIDPIVDNSIFSNGSGVIGATTLEELIPQDDFISEQLLASGGNANDAEDTILTTTGQQIVLWPIPPEREIAPPPADPATQIENAAASAGLSGEELLPLAMPKRDGVQNLMKFAFNLDFSKPDSRTWLPGSDSGLPLAR
ncbi:MAG: hypothetical protein P8L44_04990 [Opitutales bacterium]|nr:hypothetical protein [Opitutales bacterium]